MKATIIFAILTLASSISFAQEISLVNNKWFTPVEKISSPENLLVYRELIHPSRLGVSVVDANGQATLGLVFVKSTELIPATKAALQDMHHEPIKMGSKIRGRIHSGTRLVAVDAQVLVNFENRRCLISVDEEFTKLALAKSISFAIENLGYDSLKVILAEDFEVVK